MQNNKDLEINQAGDQQSLLNNGIKPQFQNYKNPIIKQCFQCHKLVTTEVKNEIGMWTILCGILWCFVAFLPGLLPFFIQECKDYVHYCPDCKKHVDSQKFDPFNCDSKEEKKKNNNDTTDNNKQQNQNATQNQKQENVKNE